jgi:hypothetical protein
LVKISAVEKDKLESSIFKSSRRVRAGEPGRFPNERRKVLSI